MDKRGGIKIFRRKNFVSQCRKVRRGILYCCISFGYRKSLDKRGEYQDFPSKIFCLTVRKFSVGESFTVAVICGSEKVYGQEGGGEYQDFPSKIFGLTVPKISVAESFTVALILRTEKVWGGGGVSRFSVEKILSHSAEKSVGESFTVALVSGIEKIWIRGGSIKTFRRKFFVS